MNPISVDVLIIGGGAAGLMCAMEAGKRGRTVAVLEHNDRVGKKIGISGGGRCNFTNLYTRPENYLSQNPDFCKSALARYTPHHFLRLVESHGIAYHEKKLGQQFCDFSSKEIITLLLDECARAHVAVQLNCRIQSVRKTDRFLVETSQGLLASTSLVVASGGLSISKIGATDLGYRLARQFGLTVTELRPGLVPLTFGTKEAADYAELSGIALPTVARHRGQSFAENILITHRGVSGPAILQISSYWQEGETLHLDLLPDVAAGVWLVERHSSTMELTTALSEKLPQRFARFWSERHAPSRPLNRFKKRELEDIGQMLNDWPLPLAGSEGYAKAEVTLGGVDTSRLSSKTMEARDVPGLFFIGEVVDVTGHLGGYNFQWAWASGHAAGQFV